MARPATKQRPPGCPADINIAVVDGSVKRFAGENAEKSRVLASALFPDEKWVYTEPGIWVAESRLPEEYKEPINYILGLMMSCALLLADEAFGLERKEVGYTTPLKRLVHKKMPGPAQAEPGGRGGHNAASSSGNPLSRIF